MWDASLPPHAGAAEMAEALGGWEGTEELPQTASVLRERGLKGRW